MSNLEFHVFKRNTDAIATNRGFYYQYLKTIKLWIDNYKNKKDTMDRTNSQRILENPENRLFKHTKTSKIDQDLAHLISRANQKW